MKYETYWSILDSPALSIRSHDISLCLFIISTLSWILIRKFKKDKDNVEKTILLWFTGIIILISTSSFVYLKLYDKDSSYNNAVKLLESSKVRRVEGLISNFQRGRITSRRGVEFESFRVDTIDFYYSNELLGKFNQFGNTKNSIFKNGLPVRITYGKEHNKILKIEIAKVYKKPFK